MSLNLFMCILKVTNEKFMATSFDLSVQDVVVECHTYAHRGSPQLGGPFSPNRPNLPRTNPQTPRRRKKTASVCLQGIKITMPNNLTLTSISRRLVSTLNLQYVPDDWQVHLIHRILQGYDSVFCAGTGYAAASLHNRQSFSLHTYSFFL